MQAKLVTREVLPFLLSFAALAVAALLLDGLLHLFDLVWVGRWLGIPGTLLIIGSFAYSLRKRGMIQVGQPARLLLLHQRMAWLGSLLILVHAGVHFNAILGWLAVWAMLIDVASGMTGKFLLQRSRHRLEQARERMRLQGAGAAEIEERLYRDSLTFDAMKQWRAVHLPITLVFAVLATAHIVSVFLFWGWQ